MDQTKREGLARGQKQGKKTKDHGLMYVTGLLQACSRRQIIHKMKHYSHYSLNVLVLMSISFSPQAGPFFGLRIPQ